MSVDRSKRSCMPLRKFCDKANGAEPEVTSHRDACKKAQHIIDSLTSRPRLSEHLSWAKSQLKPVKGPGLVWLLALGDQDQGDLHQGLCLSSPFLPTTLYHLPHSFCDYESYSTSHSFSLSFSSKSCS